MKLKIKFPTQNPCTKNRYLIKPIACGVLTIIACAFSLKTAAFDPDEAAYGHSMITRSIATEGYIGWGERTKLPGFSAQLRDGSSVLDTLNFTSDAVEQLVLGARSMDFLGSPVRFEGAGINDSFFSDYINGGLYISGQPFEARAHCDDERIVECSRYIHELTIGPDKNTVTPVDRYNNESAVTLLMHAANLTLLPATANDPDPSPSDADEKQALAYAAAARVRVGRSLHVTQDFYAHSNWSDYRVNGDSILIELGQGAKDSSTDIEIAKLTARDSSACVARVVPAATVEKIREYERVSLPATLRLLASTIPFNPFDIGTLTPYADYAADTDLKPREGLRGVIEEMILSWAIGLEHIKREILNFETSGGNWELTAGEKITSGYFDSAQHLSLGLGSATDRANSKCDHGFMKKGSKLSGINKDMPWGPIQGSGPTGSTGTTALATPLHKAASYHAAKGTRQIFDNVIKAIEDRSGYTSNKNTETTRLRNKMVELFMGSKQVVGFVIDNTGSMQDVIDGITAQVEAISTAEAGTVAVVVPDLNGPSTIELLNPAKKFSLTTYTESASNVASITMHRFEGDNPQRGRLGSAVDLVKTLKKLPPAIGGGDCPEPTLNALLQTVRTLPRKSKIFVFTDASTKDNDTQGSDGLTRKESAEIARLVDKKKLEVTFSLSGSCSPISPAYHQIAQASGGQVMLVDHTSTDTGVALAGVAPGNRAFSVIHTERNSLAAGASKGVVIAVESGASQLLISVTNDSSAIAVRNPAGELQTLTTFLGGSLLKVSNPAPGNWSIGVSGWPTTPPGAPASAYSIKAQAIGAFDLGTLEYSNKDAAGRSGHEIHMPYGNSPPSTDVRVAAQLSTNAPTNPTTYQWEALAEDGTVLGPLNLARKTPDQYEGTASIATISANATRAWRVRVRGTDSTGQPFARTLPTLQNATRVTANITQLPNHWVPGAEHLVKIRIDNYGAADGFSLPGSASLGQLIGITPNSEVPAGDYAIVTAKLSIPANTPANSAGLLKLSLNSRNAANGTLQTINIPYTVLQDTDGDGVPDIVEQGSNGIDANFDGNADGIPDWKQANVISLPSDQRRAYLTASLSAGQFRLARTAPAEGLAQLKYTIDLIDFKIIGLAAGGSTQMKLQLPGYMTASGYGKFGPVPGNTTAAWYDFNYDATSGVGAKVDKNIVTLYLKDGAKGDDDLTANGEIIDIGGPVGVQIAGVGTASTGSTTATTTPSGTATTGTTATPTTGTGTGTTTTGNPDGSGTNAPGANPFSGSSGGGGCTVGDPSNPNPDASLWLLLLAALAVLGARTLQAVQPRQRYRRY